MLASNYMAYMGLSENDGKTSKYMGDSWFIIITFPLKHTILIHFGGISWYNYLNFRHPSITHTLKCFNVWVCHWTCDVWGGVATMEETSWKHLKTPFPCAAWIRLMQVKTWDFLWDSHTANSFKCNANLLWPLWPMTNDVSWKENSQ